MAQWKLHRESDIALNVLMTFHLAKEFNIMFMLAVRFRWKEGQLSTLGQLSLHKRSTANIACEETKMS